jgi:hypothetical protein
MRVDKRTNDFILAFKIENFIDISERDEQSIMNYLNICFKTI